MVVESDLTSSLSFYLAARDIAPTGFYRDRAKREQGSTDSNAKRAGRTAESGAGHHKL
jgi:hypothetical protein